MQLPLNSHPPTMPVPVRYNSYFSSTPQSRPIRINAPSTRFEAYNLPERVMGLDFDHPSSTNQQQTTSDSVYFMDFYDDDDVEQPHASSSHSIYHTSNSIEETLRRTLISEDDKENNTSQSPVPSKTNTPTKTVTSSQMYGYKRQPSLERDFLINEETESEAGFSGDDDECMSNCGCVHNGVDENNVTDNASTAPFSRLGFRSVGDIIGYAQVVRAERLEALAELRNAVEKFNDMRQRNQNLRSNNKMTTN